MNRLKYIFFLTATILLSIGYNSDLSSTFDEDEGLKNEFPESLFDFDFTPLMNGEQTSNSDSIHIPIPLDQYSFANFKATSDVKNENGIRFVECILDQETYGVPDSASFANNIFMYNYVDEANLNIKLNVATSGDAINGDLFEKHILLDFLEEGKTYPTDKDQLGAIELTYFERNSHSLDNQSKPIWLGINAHDNLGESDYTVKIISVEDYDDLTREGELIKSALRVVLEFEGLIGVSSHPHLEEELKADQWEIKNGIASFIVDYIQ